MVEKLAASGLVGAQPIGSGATSSVYRAVDQRFQGRVVAVKVFRADVSDQELRALASLPPHPNVVTGLETRRLPDGTPVLITAFMEHGSLQDIVERGPLAAVHARKVLTEVADGLAAVHAAGVVHRDLKPGNIFLGERAQIGDFGAALVGEVASPDLVYTPHYVAPEVLEYNVPTPASDVYSLGVTGLTLLTGINPFEVSDEANRVAVLTRVSDPAIDLSNIRPPRDIDADLWRVLATAASRDPSRRPTAAHLADQLRAADPATWKPAARARLIGAAVAVAALVFAAAVVMWPRGCVREVSGFGSGLADVGSASDAQLQGELEANVPELELASDCQLRLVWGDAGGTSLAWSVLRDGLLLDQGPLRDTLSFTTGPGRYELRVVDRDGLVRASHFFAVDLQSERQ